MKKKELNCNKTFNKNEIKKLIYWFLINYGSIRTTKLLDELKFLGFKYATNAGISLGIEDLKIPEIKIKLIENTEKHIKKTETKLKTGEIDILKKLEKITESWNNTNEVLKNELITNFRQTDLLNPVYMMTFSGARGNISQIKQLVGMRGLMSDSKGEIINLPIKSNLKEGLKITEYFISCYGARKGLIDTALKTANSGYLTRRLIYVAQSQTIKQSNCKTNKGILIMSLKKDKNAYNTTKKSIIGRVLAKDINKNETNKPIASAGQDICNYLAKKIMTSKKIYIKSPLTCLLNKGSCQLCYGWNLGNGRLVELGESVGILAAQSIGEPGTQLTMRTFHTGGVFSGEVKETIKSPYEGKIFYNCKKGGKKIETKYGEKVFFTLKEKKIIIQGKHFKKSMMKLPKYSIIFTKPKQKVFLKQIIGETSNWKQLKLEKKKKKEIKEIKEIKTNISGQIFFDKITHKTLKSKKIGIIWILHGNIQSYYLIVNNLKKQKYVKEKKLNLKKNNKDCNNKINKKSKTKLKLTFLYKEIIKNTKSLKKKPELNKVEIKYNINKILQEKKQILIRKIKTQKIIERKNLSLKIGQFLYKGKKFWQKIRNNYCSQIIQINKKTIIIRKTNPYLITENSKINIKNNSLIKKNNLILLNEYEKQKTEDIVQGLPKIEELLEAKKTKNLELILNNPYEKLKKQYKKMKKKYNNKISTRKSIQKIQNFIIKKIQNVYISQGVEIANKHMEIIIKEMTSRVIIQETGDSKLISGEIIELNKIEKINKHLINKANYEPILLGISKLSLSNQSFIAEASFQETTKMLTKAAIEGKIDWLYGLKENLVLGNLIPVGTGYKKY
jgi:hypothetical protein